VAGVDNEREASGEDSAHDFGQQNGHADAQRDRQPGASRPALAVIVCHGFRVRAGCLAVRDAPNSGRSRFRIPFRNILGPFAILGGSLRPFRGEEMAGQAGWYRAPGEEGLLRYWNGTIWTDHRQPDPAAVVTPEPEQPPADVDPMAEYERQFATPSVPYSSFDRPSFDFDAHPLEEIPEPRAAVPPSTQGTDVVVSPAQPQYRPQSALTSAPIAPVPVPEPEFAGKTASAPRSLGPIALGPAAPATTPTLDAPESEFDRVYNEMAALATAPAPALFADPAEQVAPTAAPANVGIAPNRKAVLGAAKIMVAAVILIVIGVGATVLTPLLSSPGAGEVRTNALVTSLGATTANSCTPVARFAVAGKSYTANSSVAISPCPIGLGESVSVVYAAANPASAARIEVGSSVTQYLWLISIVGGLVFVAALIIFIIRAGSLVGGITLLRDGRRREAEPVAAE
jgi:hypothetical protein